MVCAGELVVRVGGAYRDHCHAGGSGCFDAGGSILDHQAVGRLLAEREIEVDHVTVYRWVQRFTPQLADAARFARHSPGDRWYVDETYVKVNGVWRYVYRTVDQHGQIIEVLLSARRHAAAARRFFTRALRMLKETPSEVVTDAAPVYPDIGPHYRGRAAAAAGPGRGAV